MFWICKLWTFSFPTPCRVSWKLFLASFYVFLKLGNELLILYDFSYFQNHASEAYWPLYGNKNQFRGQFSSSKFPEMNKHTLGFHSLSLQLPKNLWSTRKVELSIKLPAKQCIVPLETKRAWNHLSRLK